VKFTDKIKHAREAAKKSSCWAYRNNYVTGEQTISVHEPTDHTVYLTSVHSWDYAKQAGCSMAAARAHLRILSKCGVITQQTDRTGSVLTFRLPRDSAVSIGREIIKELVAEGLPFDDEWRKARVSA